MTPQQVIQLLKGDILLKYPLESNPNDKSDPLYEKLAEMFEIRSINTRTSMIELVTPAGSYPMFTLPGDVAKQFIKSSDLITEKVWWLN